MSRDRIKKVLSTTVIGYQCEGDRVVASVLESLVLFEDGRTETRWRISPTVKHSVNSRGDIDYIVPPSSWLLTEPPHVNREK